MTEVLPFFQKNPAMVDQETVIRTLLAAASLGKNAVYTPEAVMFIMRSYVIAMNALFRNDAASREAVLQAARWYGDVNTPEQPPA